MVPCVHLASCVLLRLCTQTKDLDVDSDVCFLSLHSAVERLIQTSGKRVAMTAVACSDGSGGRAIRFRTLHVDGIASAETIFWRVCDRDCDQ
jgi:hypothetical protein